MSSGQQAKLVTSCKRMWVLFVVMFNSFSAFEVVF